jgi:hypothetical protein
MVEQGGVAAATIDARVEPEAQRLARDRAAAAVVMARLDEQAPAVSGRAEDLLLVGQAQGMLMGQLGVDAYDALRALAGSADRDSVELPEAARRIVAAFGRTRVRPAAAVSRSTAGGDDELGRKRHQRDGG